MYNEILGHAVEAERLGFGGFALTEHHFWYDGYCPSLMPVLAAIARRTQRITILPLALLLPLRDPLFFTVKLSHTLGLFTIPNVNNTV